MQIDILPTAQAAEAYDFKGRQAVVIDVLRATSVMTMALANGAEAVWPVATVDEAFLSASSLGRDRALLGGERNADRIEGFDLGNSPQDYTTERMAGKTVVLTTTNGTLAMRNAAGADGVIVASMLNRVAVTQRLASAADSSRVAIVCSGNYGLPTLEDCLCAALLAKGVEDAGRAVAYESDYAICVRMMAEAYETGGMGWFANSVHYNRLIAKGYAADVDTCLRHDGTISVVPRLMADGLVRVG